VSFQRRFTGSDKDKLFDIGGNEAEEYCGKCKPSQCIYRMFEAFNPEEKKYISGKEILELLKVIIDSS